MSRLDEYKVSRVDGFSCFPKRKIVGKHSNRSVERLWIS